MNTFAKTRHPANNVPFKYYPKPEVERATDVLLRMLRAMVKVPTLIEDVEIIIQSLNREIRHAFYYRFNVPITAVDDRDINMVRGLVMEMIRRFA